MDREKVIKATELLDDFFNEYIEVYYISPHEAWEIVKDTLKKQEPMQVKMDIYGNAYCPWCSTDKIIEMGVQRLHLGTKFCPYCGQAVKWE